MARRFRGPPVPSVHVDASFTLNPENRVKDAGRCTVGRDHSRFWDLTGHRQVSEVTTVLVLHAMPPPPGTVEGSTTGGQQPSTHRGCWGFLLSVALVPCQG